MALRKKEGCCKLEKEALDSAVWRTGIVKTLWKCRKADHGVKECGW